MLISGCGWLWLWLYECDVRPLRPPCTPDSDSSGETLATSRLLSVSLSLSFLLSLLLSLSSYDNLGRPLPPPDCCKCCLWYCLWNCHSYSHPSLPPPDCCQCFTTQSNFTFLAANFPNLIYTSFYGLGWLSCEWAPHLTAIKLVERTSRSLELWLCVTTMIVLCTICLAIISCHGIRACGLGGIQPFFICWHSQ